MRRTIAVLMSGMSALLMLACDDNQGTVADESTQLSTASTDASTRSPATTEPETSTTGPTTTESTTTEPTTTTAPTTPTTQPPVLPEAAKENTPEGARAFVRYYVDVRNYAWLAESGDIIRRDSVPVCDVCTDSADIVDTIVRLGGYHKSGDWTVQEQTMLPKQSATRPTVVTAIHIAPTRWRMSTSTPERHRPAKDVEYDFELRWRGQWQLVEIRP